jgi:peptide/nickel transport system permease protein
MISAVAPRLARTLLLFFGVSVLAFILMDMAPGKYLEEMKLNPQISPNTLAALRAEYGVDRPLAVRYLLWLNSSVRGEFGFSFAYNCPVWPLLRVRAANTLMLTVTAMLFSWAFAIPIGILAAAHAGRWQDQASAVSTTFLLATPDILIGLALLAFALHTRWFPAGGMRTLASSEMGLISGTQDFARHLFLPAVGLSAGTLPTLIRHVRSATLDVLDSPFIAAARGHGIRERRILLRHVLPAAANPLISLLGFSVGTLLSGSLLIEVIMSWPGVGPLLLQAVLERDVYIVVAAIMFSTLFLITGNLMADALLYIADPRIRKDQP